MPRQARLLLEVDLVTVEIEQVLKDEAETRLPTHLRRNTRDDIVGDDHAETTASGALERCC